MAIKSNFDFFFLYFFFFAKISSGEKLCYLSIFKSKKLQFYKFHVYIFYIYIYNLMEKCTQLIHQNNNHILINIYRRSSTINTVLYIY